MKGRKSFPNVIFRLLIFTAVNFVSPKGEKSPFSMVCFLFFVRRNECATFCRNRNLNRRPDTATAPPSLSKFLFTSHFTVIYKRLTVCRYEKDVNFYSIDRILVRLVVVSPFALVLVSGDCSFVKSQNKN